jgi:hypothetical protein
MVFYSVLLQFMAVKLPGQRLHHPAKADSLLLQPNALSGWPTIRYISQTIQ